MGGFQNSSQKNNNFQRNYIPNYPNNVQSYYHQNNPQNNPQYNYNQANNQNYPPNHSQNINQNNIQNNYNNSQSKTKDDNNKQYFKEKMIDGIPILSLEQNKIILEQLEKCVCKIKRGTGFLCKIYYPDEFHLLPVLMTNNHVVNEDDLIMGGVIDISFNNDKIYKKIIINNSRKTYTNKDLDVTIIQIHPDSDTINDYIDIDDYNKKQFKKGDNIYLLQYPKGFEASLSIGTLLNITEKNIEHRCSTTYGSSGGPILNLSNYKLIGIHKESTIFNFNRGTFIKYIVEEFNKKCQKNHINKNNYITAEIYITNVNKHVRIINTYEEYQRDFGYDYKKEKENENEIKNCEIKINNKVIPFSYFYKFDKPGKYVINYIFKNYLTNTNYMFICLVDVHL